MSSDGVITSFNYNLGKKIGVGEVLMDRTRGPVDNTQYTYTHIYTTPTPSPSPSPSFSHV